MRAPMMVTEPGITGMFTRDQAEGAIPNGSRVSKCNSVPYSDATPDGTGGVVLGSIGPIDLKIPSLPPMFGYWVMWDNRPNHAVFIMGLKVQKEEPVDNGHKIKI